MFAVKGIVDARELELCMSELMDAGLDCINLAGFVFVFLHNWVRFTFRVFE